MEDLEQHYWDCAICFEYVRQEIIRLNIQQKMLDEWSLQGPYCEDTPVIERLDAKLDINLQRRLLLQQRCHYLNDVLVTKY